LSSNFQSAQKDRHYLWGGSKQSHEHDRDVLLSTPAKLQMNFFSCHLQGFCVKKEVGLQFSFHYWNLIIYTLFW